MLFEAAWLLKGFLFLARLLTGSFLCRSDHGFAVLPANNSVTALVMSLATLPRWSLQREREEERDPIKGIFHKSPGVCVSKLHSLAQPLLTIETSGLHIRPLNPLMSSFFLMHADRGRKSGTNGAWGIGFVQPRSSSNFQHCERVFCYVVLPKSMTDLISTAKLRKIFATSSWWHIKLKCLKCNMGLPLPSARGPPGARL